MQNQNPDIPREARVVIHSGVNHDGYWTSDMMVEKVITC